jgi:hypothetical protein
VHVLAVHLHRRAVRRFRKPYVQILALPRFEEEDVVAVVQVGELIQLVQLGLSVEFGVFARVRQKRMQVGEEVAVAEGDAPGGLLCV